MKIEKLKYLRGKKILVTGHTGFKGSWLCIMLNLLGAKIYGVSLKPEKNSLFIKAKISNLIIKSYIFDITNKKKTESNFKKNKSTHNSSSCGTIFSNKWIQSSN